MSIFGSILSRIFPSNHPAVATTAPAPSPPAAAPATAASPPQTPATSGAQAGVERVDVEQVLTGLAAKRSEKLNWRTSIVDLMKLLGIDSSLAARQKLAAELHYGGDMNDSASMNIWLHKQVMQKLEDNGGRVPEDLKH